MAMILKLDDFYEIVIHHKCESVRLSTGKFVSIKTENNSKR